MSHDYAADVRAFHEKFGAPIGTAPRFSRPALRAALIREEARETADAIEAGDMTEVADGLCDVLYVVFGAAIEMGIDLEPIFAEVHRTNMAKVGGGERADGKIMKPPGWTKPDVGGELRAQGWQP